MRLVQLKAFDEKPGRLLGASPCFFHCLVTKLGPTLVLSRASTPFSHGLSQPIDQCKSKPTEALRPWADTQRQTLPITSGLLSGGGPPSFALYENNEWHQSRRGRRGPTLRVEPVQTRLQVCLRLHVRGANYSPAAAGFQSFLSVGHWAAIHHRTGNPDFTIGVTEDLTFGGEPLVWMEEMKHQSLEGDEDVVLMTSRGGGGSEQHLDSDQASLVLSAAATGRASAAATSCSFKAAGRLAHAKTSYCGGEQTAGTQRKLCFNVISG
ncbi:unnamed protein product [Pleuronectes platessa]|uniref:Uncharacterized protein n=1 Tax=Pleuronectes platessa TaxID=8262 RepID=A0A9N7THD9_PLEPL|nr:unnamed protein product [Pleuronectes platessa]